ncbi:uncharacterized protein [Temnothorax longispinosus]|uniref:uncharacterized protein isoform X2 n=1 Tax=Temnothorax longispinosus TaxID=300112 RepID=UPI003A98E6B8
MPRLEPYQLVSFTDYIVNGLRSVECIPNSWISYDTKIGSCIAPYMEPPYGDEDKKLIQDLIKNMSDPPESWPLYKISLQGHASTYSEGMKRIKKLCTQEFVYTTATEDEGETKSKAITNLIKNANPLKVKSIKDLLSRKNLSSDNESEAESLTNSEHCKPTDESSSGSEPVCPTFHKKIIKQNVKKVYNKSPANYDGKNQTKDILKKSAISSSIHGQSSASTSSSINVQNITAGKKATEKLKTSKVLPSKCQKTVDKENIPTNLSGHGDQNKRNKDQLIDENEVNNIFTSKSDAILYRTLMRLVTVVKSHGEEIKELRYTIERSLKIDGCRITTNTFVEKYEFEKIRSVDDFRAFDNRLKDDEDFRNDFSAAIDCIAESKMKKTINAVLKKFFAQEFALKCTAVRESKKKGEKLILKETQFYEQLFEFVRRIHSVEETVTEKIYYQNLAMCLNNSKDWDGGRKMRQRDV